MKVAAVATAVAAPTYGPAIVTLFGIDMSPPGIFLSVSGLILARWIAPPPLRKLTRTQESALTMLLLIVLFLIVTGQLFGEGRPLGPGMSVMWGVGLGFSGLLAVEFFSERVLAMIRAAFEGSKGPPEE